MPARKMHLVAYLKSSPTASYAGGWRSPAAPLNDLFDPARYEHIARMLEAARFTAAFFADGMGVPDIYRNSYADYLGRGGQMTLLDPLMLLPLMARATNHLGLGTTLSTTFNQPYPLARILASFDHISAGRACWNAVTSANNYESRNFGIDTMPAKDTRYDRADEVMQACFALWDCWEPDALVLDREAGVFADTTKIHRADYQGEFVSTRGPLSVPRSPQGRPVILQAGSSPRGRDFAATWSEMIFATQATKQDCLTFRADMLRRFAAIGRPDEECVILPTISVVLGETDAIAREKAAYLDSRVDPELVIASHSSLLGVDLGNIESPEDAAIGAGNQGVQGSLDRMAQTARAQGISFAQAVRKPRGLLAGTASTIADVMEDWFASGACDGFVLPPTVFPGTYEDVARMLTPELQRRGLLRRDYAGRTLRENLRNAG